MRWLTLLTACAWSVAAVPLTVLTWNLQWFPSGTAVKAPEDTELARIREAAVLVRDIAPDVLVAQEVRDFDTAYRLAKETGGLSVAVCSRLKASVQERFEVVVVAGDFNSAPEPSSDEVTLATLEKAGFTSGIERLPAGERVTWPGRGRYPDATFDYVFVRGVKATAPLIVASPVSDHYPMARTLALP